MDRAIHSRCRIEAMTEVRFFLILFPIKPYVRRTIEKEQKKQSVCFIPQRLEERR